MAVVIYVEYKTWHVVISVVDMRCTWVQYNNSNKTWHVVISVVDMSVHGYSQQ